MADAQQNPPGPGREEERFLLIDRISKRFDQVEVLSELSLRIPAGRFTTLVGPSGAGKTTLIRILAGLLAPDEGLIHLNGRELTRLTPQSRRMAVVSSRPNLFPSMTVRGNLSFSARVGRKKGEPGADLIELTRVAGVAEHMDKYPDQLSEGQKQRVTVIRAVVNRPDALLLDDPFNHLDAVTRLNLRTQLAPLLRDLNIPILFVTGDQEEAFEQGEQIAVMLHGRIEQVGAPFEVYNHPANQGVAAFLGTANLLLGRWDGTHVRLGPLALDLPETFPPLEPNQLVKIAFRAEDVVLGYQPHFYNAAHQLGNAVVETTHDLGPLQRLVVRLTSAVAVSQKSRVGERLLLVDETFPEGFSLTIMRTKWDAAETPLDPGDSVAVGLKDYRVMPHYPLIGRE
ncbi:MAG: ABC transporter ATP-binding protein [Acidobacteria bacterium]|nr:MAG: ABC transporter ATP-binding protein [Acidobacteriota bacterium]